MPPCQSEICIPLSIVDDNIVENNETLTISISTDDWRITVERGAAAVITIMDNDSEWTTVSVSGNNNLDLVGRCNGSVEEEVSDCKGE